MKVQILSKDHLILCQAFQDAYQIKYPNSSQKSTSCFPRSVHLHGQAYSPEVYSVSSKGPAAAPISAMAIVLGMELMRPQKDLGFHEMTLSFEGFTSFKKMVCKQSANTTNPLVSIVGYCRNPPQNVLKNWFCLKFPVGECRTRQVQLPCRPWHPWSRRRSWKANWLGATDVEKKQSRFRLWGTDGRSEISTSTASWFPTSVASMRCSTNCTVPHQRKPSHGPQSTVQNKKLAWHCRRLLKELPAINLVPCWMSG